jgi:DNA-binding NarL/FixJ family response regulator
MHSSKEHIDVESSVWIIEDDAMFRKAVQNLIRQQPDLQCENAFGRCEDALAAMAKNDPPDVILVDIGLPGMSGIEGIRKLKEISPGTEYIVLTIHEEDDKVYEAVRAGASGYLLKVSSADEILRAIHEAGRGGSALSAGIARKILGEFASMKRLPMQYKLTDRENEILRLLADGLTKNKLAEKLFLSRHTIDSHIRNIYSKLHVHTRGSAIAKAVRENLV